MGAYSRAFTFLTLLTAITDSRTLAFPQDAIDPSSDASQDDPVFIEHSPDFTENNDASTLETTLQQETSTVVTTDDTDLVDNGVEIISYKNIQNLSPPNAATTHSKIVQGMTEDTEENGTSSSRHDSLKLESDKDQSEGSNTLLIVCVVIIVILSLLLCCFCICMYQILTGIQIMH